MSTGRCQQCGDEHELNSARYTCPDRPAVAALPEQIVNFVANAVMCPEHGYSGSSAHLVAEVRALLGAALEAPPALTDAQAWELWEQLGTRDVSGFATKREVAEWVRAVVGRSVRGEAPPEPCPHVRTSPEGTSYCTLAERGEAGPLPPDRLQSDTIQELRRLEQRDGPRDDNVSHERLVDWIRDPQRGPVHRQDDWTSAERLIGYAVEDLLRGVVPAPPPVHNGFFPVLCAGHCDAIAYDLEQHGAITGITSAAAAVFLRQLAIDLRAVPAPPPEPELLTRLRSLLETFGEHLSDCQRPDRAKDEGCTCGFRLNLQAVRDLVPYSYEGRAVPAPPPTEDNT